MDFLEGLAAAGHMPKALAARPELPPHLTLAWELFCEASTERQIGFAVGPIPFAAIDRLAARAGIDGEDFERLRILIRAMDAVWLDHLDKRRKQGKKT